MKWIANSSTDVSCFVLTGVTFRSMMIQNYFPGVIKFLKDVDDGSFKTS
jgi:hypothetical protein